MAFGVGGGNAFAFTVGRSTHGADNGINAVTVFYGIGQAFQNNHTGAFRHNETVGAGIKRIRARFRQRTDFAEFDKRGRGHHLVHTAGNRHIKIAHAQPVDGLVNSGQRGGASGVHRKVGTVQIKHVGYTARDDVGQFARHGVFVNRGEMFPHAFVHFVNHFFGVRRG